VIRYSKYIKFLLAISDLAILNISYMVAWLVIFSSFRHPYYVMLLYINLAWVFMIGALKPYNLSRTSSYFKTLQYSFTMVAGHFLLVFAFYVFQQPDTYSRKLLFFLYTGTLSSLIFYHALVFVLLKWARKRGFNYRNIIVIVPEDAPSDLTNFFTSHPEYGYHIKLLFASEKLNNAVSRQELKNYCQDNQVHELFYSMSVIDRDSLFFLTELCETHLIRLRLMADFQVIGIKGLELESHGNTAVIKVHATPLDEWDKQILKRAFDVVFSLGVIVFFLSWALPILAICIKLDSRGPVFFKQKRTGQDNKAFSCYKLRSMRVNAESDVLQATKNDPRITRFGAFLRKSSLDELPQFFNVLIGDMSVVGPRPHMLKHTEDFMKEVSLFMLRHHIKPGITGLAQAKGYRGETPSYDDIYNRVKLDLFYVRNWSFMLDMKIIIETVF
jgi:putative colanic acid biosysnthesis UDP-glucose lipid carrier transferase